MFKTLKDLFQALAPAQRDVPGSQHKLQLATAVMLVEMMRADAELDAAERAAVLAGLQDHFALTADEAGRLEALAQQASRRASDYFAFTSQINERFGMADKLRMVEHMWRVAYADGTLSAHENHLMRKVADLLHIPHGAYVHAKLRAQQAGAATGDAGEAGASSEAGDLGDTGAGDTLGTLSAAGALGPAGSIGTARTANAANAAGMASRSDAR